MKKKGSESNHAHRTHTDAYDYKHHHPFCVVVNTVTE